MKSNKEKRYLKIRIAVVGFFFVISFILISGRAIHLQVFCNSFLSHKAATQYERFVTYQGKRGTIYDRNLTEMAVSGEVTSVAVFPPQIEEPRKTALILSKELKLDAAQVMQKLTSKDKRFVWIKRQLNPKETEAVRALRIKGVGFVPEHNRFYPNRMLAAQAIGFTGIDGKGLEGVEFYYDEYLKGREDRLKILTDALGRQLVQTPDFIEKQTALTYSGNNLILTLDKNIQYITEKALKDSIAEFSAASGIAIIMAPQTGEILAMAHYPLFNPNTFQQFGKERWRNRAVTDPFEPGSTMKIFTAAAALESGVCTPETIFFCENGKYEIDKKIIHDTHSYGWLSLKKIITYSSNIGAVKVGEIVGTEALYNTLKAFGLGEKTGIDCPAETIGSISHYKKWSKMDASAITFGHGISLSAIQLITALSAIANDGILMKPYLVQAITDPNGRHIKSFSPEKVRRVISSKTAQAIKMMMRAVIEEDGTGTKAALINYSACGKTGTARKLDENGEYTTDRYTASFIGFAPAEQPEISIIVIIDEPKKDYYGGIVAAPVFKKIALEVLNYLNIPVKNRMTAYSLELIDYKEGLSL